MLNTVLLVLILAGVLANTFHTHRRTRPDLRVDELKRLVDKLETQLSAFCTTVEPESGSFEVRLDNGAVVYKGDSGADARDRFLKHKAKGVPVKFLQNGAVRDRFPR